MNDPRAISLYMQYWQRELNKDWSSYDDSVRILFHPSALLPAMSNESVKFFLGDASEAVTEV